MLNWEEIPQDQAGFLCRTKIPGGWLVKEVQEVHIDLRRDHIDILNSKGYEWTSSICFVPDPQHQWNIDGSITVK